jgi:hypothetical protein
MSSDLSCCETDQFVILVGGEVMRPSLSSKVWNGHEYE